MDVGKPELEVVMPLGRKKVAQIDVYKKTYGWVWLVVILILLLWAAGK
jgi:hypothetical protein